MQFNDSKCWILQSATEMRKGLCRVVRPLGLLRAEELKGGLMAAVAPHRERRAALSSAAWREQHGAVLGGG